MTVRLAAALAPALVALLILILAMFELIPSSWGENALLSAIALVLIGALLSGFFLGQRIYQGGRSAPWVRILAGTLVGLVVACSYFTACALGGCLTMIVTAK